MKIKERALSLFEEKRLSPEEIAENVKEIEWYLSQISKDLLEEYTKTTGKDSIKIFSKERKEKDKYPQLEKLIAYITPESDVNLKLERFWHYETWTFRYVDKWNEDSSKHINDFETVISETLNWKESISYFKKDIFTLEKKLRSKIRNHKILKPVKQALGTIFNKKNEEK